MTTPTSNEREVPDEALARVRRYVEMRAVKPMRQLGDLIHEAHVGTEWEAELRLSDLRAVLAFADRLRTTSRPAVSDFSNQWRFSH